MIQNCCFTLIQKKIQKVSFLKKVANCVLFIIYYQYEIENNKEHIEQNLILFKQYPLILVSLLLKSVEYIEG